MLLKVRKLLSHPYTWGIIKLTDTYHETDYFFNKETNNFEFYRHILIGDHYSIPHYAFLTRREAISRLKLKYNAKEIDKFTEYDNLVTIYEANE